MSSDLVGCLPTSTGNSSYEIQTSYVSSKINNTCGFFCGSYAGAKVCSKGCRGCTSSMNIGAWGQFAIDYSVAVGECFKKEFSCKNFEIRLGFVSFAAILIFLVFLWIKDQRVSIFMLFLYAASANSCGLTFITSAATSSTWMILHGSFLPFTIHSVECFYLAFIGNLVLTKPEPAWEFLI